MSWDKVLSRLDSLVVADSAFKESDHPRDSDGKFGSGSASATAVSGYDVKAGPVSSHYNKTTKSTLSSFLLTHTHQGTGSKVQSRVSREVHEGPDPTTRHFVEEVYPTQNSLGIHGDLNAAHRRLREHIEDHRVDMERLQKRKDALKSSK